MKHLIYISLFLFTIFSFGQNTGLIVGKVLDKEMNDSPLVLASVLVKGTAIKSDTDLTGLFVIENLEDGDYTLVCSFVGYESQEIDVHVDSNEPSEVKLSLAASSISLNDLALVMASADSDPRTTTAQ
ncbi:carboxypeptidase-like regulatory domain-containing protein [Thalassobellus suaedae]|uniref:Carboxypeptidase-like regulatory domain-containing protein n=1 Tax=Thalassobellus suaedae TaxID=3074124 RepID=A0ABY9XSU1_9FLAO|nr:carboxypeptidase-like regulatory domain-containing protein [Flavobacteriaceae bacterium HL-DH14]